jgi:hypothetical protein
MMLFDDELSPPPPPPPLLACRPGVAVTTANPVVVSSSSDEVDVTTETSPLAPVLVMRLVWRRVEVPTRAEVKVVREVFSVVDSEVPPEDPGVDEAAVFDVMVVAEVVGEVIVVGVPSEVVAVVRVDVVSLVMVVLSSSLLDDEDGAGVDDELTPVPACRLWKMPSMMAFSMIANSAETDAAKAPTRSGTTTRMVTV